MKTGSLVLLVAALDLGFLLAQPASQGATITGQVVDARTRQPLRGAIVSAAKVPSNKPGDLPNIGFRTGQDGRFVLRGIAPGIVNFQVTKTGYLPGPYASVRPAADGEQIDNVMLTVPPAASLGGRVLDESGQPAAGALVTVRSIAPPPVDVTAKVPLPRDSTRTDDDGQYWIGGLGAGDYSLTVRPSGDPIGSSAGGAVLSATVRGETMVTEPPSGGQFINVKLAIGETLSDLNLVVRFPPIADRWGRFLDKPGTGSVSGRVVDSSGRGVANAMVLISQDEKALGSMAASTDSDGAFRFLNVHAGSFTVSARGDRSVAAPSDPQGPSTAPVVVAPGSQVENIVLTVRRGGTISGTITDEFGDPVSGSVIVIDPVRPNQGLTAEIIAVAVRYDGGLVASRGLVPTDARGRYRVTGLPPGEYLLGVAANYGVIANVEVHFQDYAGNFRRLARTNVYYPGFPVASRASRIAVSEGNDTANIGLVLRPTPTASIDVTITASRPVSEILLYEILLDDRLSVLEKATRITGTPAVTLDVRPGPYRLIASAKAAPGADDIERLWSSVDVEADPLVPATVHLALEPAVNITGRVIFEGTNPLRQDAGPWLIPLTSFPGIGIDLDGNRTFTVTSGEFAIEGVFPGRYVIQAGGAERSSKSAYMLKGATLGGRDVLDEPIDLRPGEDVNDVRLTVTERISELSGRVADAADTPSRDDLVLVFSADRRHWWPGSRRTRIVRPDAKGVYTVRPLPPGPYIVTLVTDPISENELPAKLPGLAGTGIRVTIAEGEQKLQNLRSTRK
jgi:protocatechuate 3,4-dioxygenase beta subunit